ncbi:MAG: conjugal transfer protein TraC, partial [Patescibacteria group bacterium]
MAFEPGKIGAVTPPAGAPPPTTVKKRQEVAKVAAEKQLLEEERVYRKGVISVRDLIAPAGLKVEPTFLILNESFLRTIFIVTYPR